MLDVQDLKKEYPSHDAPLRVLSGVNLKVDAGKSVVVMGPSGSGKSTLLNIIGTLDDPTSGRVIVAGTDPFDLSAPELARFRNRRLGFIFQDHHLLPHCTTLENVVLPTLVDKADQDGVERAEALLERVGLAERMSHLPSELSGGERQRAAIARALVNRPALILADEPTGNLDRASAEVVADLLAELERARDAAVVVVTHSQLLAGRFATHYELADGKLVAVGK